MSDFELAKLEQLCADATRGPWRVLPISDALTEIWTTEGRYGAVDPMHVADIRGWGYLTRAKEHGACGLEQDAARKVLKANGELLLAARHAIPMLLHEIKALKVQLAVERAKTDRLNGERNAALIHAESMAALIPDTGDYAFRAQAMLAQAAERDQRDRADHLEKHVERLTAELQAVAKGTAP